MNERQRIEDRLRKKEQEIQALEDKLKAARVYVQALQDVLKLISADSAQPSAASDSVLRSGSAVAQARDVILQRGAPVHINDLLEAVGKEVTRESKASLTSSLAAYVRRGEIFARPAPNTFGLIDLGHHNTDEQEPEEPPSGFGRMSPPSPPQPSPPDDDEVPF